MKNVSFITKTKEKKWFTNTGKKTQEDLNILLKACVSYFLSNFYFQPNDSLSKTMKNVFYFI